MEYDPRIHGDSVLPAEAKPSELDRRLNALKDPETGHIMVTPSQAAELLLDRLLDEHRRRAERGPHPDINLAPGSWSSPLVESLDIVRKNQGQDKIDLTQVLETFLKESEAENLEHWVKTDTISKIHPKVIKP